MPPLAPDITKAGLLRGLGGWNNSSMSPRNSVTSGLLSTRTPQSLSTTGGGILNPSIGIGVTRLAMPRNAAGTYRPRSSILTKTYEALTDATIPGAVNDWIAGGAAKQLVVKTYGPIERWNTTNVTNMFTLFSSATMFNDDISRWDTANVENMSFMFFNATSFDQDIGGWDTSNVTDMSNMFAEATSFNGDIDAWNTANVTNMSGMFDTATSFNGNISLWITTNVNDMNYMFFNANSFNGNIGGWDTANVTTMVGMFSGANQFNQDIGGWDTSIVTEMGGMFQNATSFNQDLSSWCVSDIGIKPTNFDTGATAWVGDPGTRPQWGTCPP